MFPRAEVIHFDRRSSNHIPIGLHFEPTKDLDFQVKKARPFRFEAMWLEDENCTEVVRNAWENPSSANASKAIRGKLERCDVDLKDWDFAHFANVGRELKKTWDQLRVLGKNGWNGEIVIRRKELEKKERDLMKKEEILWFQRARANEFKWGDRNTKFFHLKASGWKKRNRIHKLVDEDNRV